MAPTDDAWLHKLLLAVKARTGWAVLINTSFNARGKPILNTAREALALLRDSPAMSAVVFDDRVVELPDRPRALAPDRSCADDVLFAASRPSLRGTPRHTNSGSLGTQHTHTRLEAPSRRWGKGNKRRCVQSRTSERSAIPVRTCANDR